MKGGLGNILKQAQALQENLQKAQLEIARLEVRGESGAGLVKVTMNGRHEVSKIDIDASLFEQDRDLLPDLIAAAVNDASHRVDKLSREKMSAMAAGLNLPEGMKLPF